MTGIVKLSVGAQIALEGDGTCVVCEFVTPTSIRVRNLSTNNERVMAIEEIQPKLSSNRSPRPDLASLTEKRLSEAHQKYKAIKPLIDKSGTSKAEMAAIASQIGVGVSTVYRWLKEFREGMVMSSIIRKERADVGRSRLDPTVDKIIADVISEYWMTAEKRSHALTHREIGRRCRSAQVRAPSLPTVIERTNRIGDKEATLKRKGRAQADKFKLIEGSVPNSDRPYSMIQIDHTLVDIELVDSVNRVSIGRPWITVAIDVYSRMIAGYYVSFDPPGMLGTGICIANAILPKRTAMGLLGVDYDYPCMGKPGIIHLDNAREFHSVTLDRACQEYGIDIQFRKIATPRYGGHIERLMGTFAEEIKALNGTTFSNFIQKGDYDSAKNATFTLSQFEVWLAHLFLGVYHQRVHSAINEPPLRRYSNAFMGTALTPFPGLIDYIPNEEKLRLDFLPLFEGTIQPYGVKIDHVTYSADVLRRWVGAKDPKALSKKRKFIFRRDPRNISYIYFYDPDAKAHFKVPYRDRTRPAISLWELRAVRTFLVQQGKAAVDENTLFRAYDAMRAIEQQQHRETGKVRRSDAAKRAIRRKESPQPKPLVDAPLVPPPQEAQFGCSENIGPGDGFEEIERY